MGKYLYCIIRSGGPDRFAARGIGDRGDDVYSVTCGTLAAVVSESPLVEYDNSRRNMMAHTRVLEEAMQAGPILPVRFGVIAPDEAAIAEGLLTRRGEELSRALDALEGRVELGLKAFWFEDVIFREIVEESPPIRALRDSLAGRSQEETYYERIKLGEMVEAEMKRRREADAERILTHLRPLAEELRLNAMLTERMVLNAAFLIERSKEPDFDQAITALDAELGKRLVFKYVGPVPPYNFVNLTIGWS